MCVRVLNREKEAFSYTHVMYFPYFPLLLLPYRELSSCICLYIVAEGCPLDVDLPEHFVGLVLTPEVEQLPGPLLVDKVSDLHALSESLCRDDQHREMSVKRGNFDRIRSTRRRVQGLVALNLKRGGTCVYNIRWEICLVPEQNDSPLISFVPN